MNNPNTLASQYHIAKLERKCLTTSFKIKSNSNASESLSRPNASQSVARRKTSSAATVTFELKKIPTEQPKEAKPKLSLANEYHAARRGYASSRPVKDDKENRENSMVSASVPSTNSPKNQCNTREPAKRAKIKPRNTPKPKGGLSKDSTRKSYASSVYPKPSSTASSAIKTERLLPPAQPTEIIPPRHTASSGYELFDLVTSKPNGRTQEHGLVEGIQVHLIESIKLCGLRKGREKSITDMVTTLCNHLLDREKDADQWSQFADKIVIVAAEKLSLSLLEKEAANASIDWFRENSNAVANRLAALRQEIISLKEEVLSAKNYTLQLLDQYEKYLDESWRTSLKQEFLNHIVTVKSECEMKMMNAMEEQSARHNKEKSRLESNISTLKDTIKSEREQMAKLNDELKEVSIAVGEEKRKQMALKEGFDKQCECLHDKLTKSDAEIVRLQALLEEERSNKHRELEAMENRMENEFDEIEIRVKRSMKLLTESKDKEIQVALRRAREAEQVLAELRDTVLPVISTAEESGEK